MKRIPLLALIGGTLAAGDAIAQNPPSAVQPPSARNGVNEQLDAISARIDRRLARGRLSRDDATAAHREVDDIQAEAGEDRLRDGGQLSEADRFAIEARIHRLEEQIEGERTPVPGAAPRS
jgi:hypothetical protein